MELKLTPTLIEEIQSRVQLGAAPTTSLRLSGIGPEEWTQIQRRVELGQCSESEELLVEAVELAESELKHMVEMVIVAAAVTDPLAARWWRERRFPAEYGEPQAAT
jgi:hypothetical protein